MKFLFALLLFSVSFANAQSLDFMQSSPSLKWESISNESVEVIYPDYLQAESVYIANLVEHYSQFVGKTYNIMKPKKFSLVIRAESGVPNGYVTLAPRRSEWFSSSMFSPLLGSLEWYQVLSIHEYRHVNQFDYFNRKMTKVLYYIMGDFGEQLAALLTLPSWYFEGDAVWAETKYTDGGRGRSPRFVARLKALVLSDKIPTYDQFLGGSYNTDLPNYYVWGYVLISYGTQKFGDDVWQRVISSVAGFTYPLRFYHSFNRVTGQRFEDFYNEAMNDVKTKWSKDAPPAEQKQEFRDMFNPTKVGNALYYVGSDLDTRPAIYKTENGATRKIAEVAYSPDLTGFHFGTNKAVTTEFLPSPRYIHKSYSDLMVYDLSSGDKERITHDLRLYNPRFNQAQTKIITADFRPDNSWNLSEYDLKGQLIQTFSLPEGKVEEASYLDDQTAVAIIGSKIGLRSLVVIDLKEKKVVKTLLAPSRNMIYGVNIDKDKNILLEGQYKGRTEIFKAGDAGFARCSHARIGAYLPSSDGTNVYYRDQDTFGSKVVTTALSACEAIPETELVNFNYLGDDPSDNYNKFPVQSLPDQEGLYTKNAAKYQAEPYGDFDTRLFIPHTWGLNLGRGGGLGVFSDNYLRTLSLDAVIGTDAEEGGGYGHLGFEVKKYYPVFRLQGEARDRKVTEFETDNETKWKEKSASLGVTIPYMKRSGHWNFLSGLYFNGTYTDASDYELNEVELEGTTNYFYKTSSALSFAWFQDGTHRSLMAPWLISYGIKYDNAEQPSDSALSSYRLFQAAVAQTPGVWKHDGFRFIYNHQKRDASDTSYKFLPEGISATGYVFSRGYTYEDVPEYQKLSANYVFPMFYPDINWGRWVYFKRIFANGFFDSTTIEDDTKLEPTLNSYGMELYFETNFLRFLPASLGFRVLQRLTDNEVRGEFFLAVGAGF